MSDNLPWTEKYRPQTFGDITGNEQNIKTIRNMLLNNSLPHLLLYGPSGSGKTSLILNLAKELYGNNMSLMAMKLDASDDRGINSVREQIKGFAEKQNMFRPGIKLIILDEADSMTFDAQFALRRIIEKYSNNTRFCLICNYENKIIPAIRSRCANFRFSPINKEKIIEKLFIICENEKIKIDNECLNMIAAISEGDLRKSINLLQSISMKSNIITIDLCYESAGLPTINIVDNIYNILINKEYNFSISYNIINIIIKDNGYSLSSLLKELTFKILNFNIKMNNCELAELIIELSDLENKISKTTFTDIYITALISIFKKN
jgi:replication factor C subunit 3/5